MAEYAVSAADRTYIVRVEDEGAGMRVQVGGEPVPVRLERWVGSTQFRLVMDGVVRPTAIRRSGDEVIVTLGDEQYRLRVGLAVPIPRKAAPRGSASAREITAPMPGLVVSVEVAVGDTVEQGRAVAVMEAMKMQSELRAPLAGKVTAVRVRAGEEVAGGTVMVIVEPARDQR